jgi:UDP-glucose 4-epimerase
MADGSLSRVLITARTPLRTRHNGPLILSSGNSVTVNDIVEPARSVTSAELPAEHVPPKPGEMSAVIIDISAARAPGYAPQFDLKAGIATVWPEFSETAR